MFTIELAIIVAIVVGLTEVIKKLGIQDRWIPLIAIVTGIAVNYLSAIVGVETSQVILGGLIAGLMAVGAWEVGKHSVLGK